MGPISIAINIDAPRERVWDVIADLSARPAFTGHFASEYRLSRENPVGEGAGARMRVDAPGGIEHMETVLAEAERPSRLLERGRGGRWDRVPVNAAWELTAQPADMTRLKLTVWTEPSKPIDRIRDLGAARWWRRRWSRALRRLADLIESGAEPGATVAVAGSDRLPLA